MPADTVAPAPESGLEAEDDGMFDLDLRVVPGPVVPYPALATQGDCVMTDNCTRNRH